MPFSWTDLCNINDPSKPEGDDASATQINQIGNYLENSVSLITYLKVSASDSVGKNAADFVCDGVDDDVEIAEAISRISLTGGTIELLDGTYIPTLPIYLPDNVRVKGQGIGTVIKTCDKVQASLSANATAGAYAVSCNTTGFRVGMFVTLFDDAHTGYQGGETNTIMGITPGTPGTITLDTALLYSYQTSANAVIFSSNSILMAVEKTGITIENLCLDGNRDNNTVGNFDTAQNGIEILGSTNCILSKCFIRNCFMAGVIIAYQDSLANVCSNIVVNDNEIYNNQLNAVHCHGVEKSTFSGNNLSGGSQAAFYMFEGYSNTISSNTASDAEIGFMISSCTSNTISGNSANNCKHGFYTANGDGATVSRNNVYTGNTSDCPTDEGNYVYQVQSDYNTFIGNSSYQGDQGFMVTGSYNNISGNTIKEPAGNNGILINGGAHNNLSHNNINGKTGWGNAILLYNASNNMCAYNSIDATYLPHIAESGTCSGNIILYDQPTANCSTSSQSGFSSDTYLAGSFIAFPGTPRVGTTYRLLFDVTKTAAGTAAPTITIRTGTAGTTSDTSRCSIAFGSGTVVADTGLFEVICTFRTIGSGTSAVIQSISRLTSNLTTTGLSNAVKAKTVTSSGFDSTTSGLGIGASYNGGSSASHTIQLVRAELVM